MEDRTWFLPEDVMTVAPTWQQSLQDVMDRSAVFKYPSQRSVLLECTVLTIKLPLFGANMTTNVAAQYKLIDRSTSKVIYNQLIDTPATVPFGYSISGDHRRQHSFNVAVQNNIAAFLANLEASPLASTK